ncbi:hypothetical protein GBF38_022173, partial [Nibea albiflora]
INYSLWLMFFSAIFTGKTALTVINKEAIYLVRSEFISASCQRATGGENQTTPFKFHQYVFAEVTICYNDNNDNDSGNSNNNNNNNNKHIPRPGALPVSMCLDECLRLVDYDVIRFWF